MIEEKIKELGYELPETAKPVATYIPAIQIENLIFTAGQIPFVKGELKFKGKIGKELSIEEGQKAAEICALNCLSAVKGIINNLNKIERIVKLMVFVNSADNFSDQSKVANGASELLGKIFDEKGKHVRSAVGVSGLPLNASVEVEMIAAVKALT